MVENQIIKFWNSLTLDCAASNSARLNSATIKATSLNKGASLIKKKLLWELNIVAVVML